MKKNKLLTLTASFLILHSSASAALTAHTELFTSGNGVPSGWTPFGTAFLAINTGNVQTDDDGSTNVSGASLDGNLDGAMVVNSTSSDGNDIYRCHI
ncbi:hypothetical protein [Rubritalea tangerina]|uniref:PEP-CTERM sorting domain-containing protein n=1 Tax=Rubritalea tangerina TaxID=430798 RepID=A0ABW4ZG39_9BACT